MSTVVAFELPPSPPATVRKKLTEAVLSKIGLGERVYDEQVRGFFALGISGGVSFVVSADLPKHKQQFGRTKTIVRVIGRWSPDRHFGNETTIKAARSKALEWSGLIRQGTDPRPTNRIPTAPRATGGITLQAMHDDYIESVTRGSKRQGRPASEGSLRTYRFDFKRVPEEMKKKRIHDVVRDRKALKELHDSIDGHPAANSTLKFLKRIAKHAREIDETVPPFPPINYYGKSDKKQPSLALHEIGGWWRDIQAVVNPMRRYLALFQVVTGLRMTDARKARAEHMDRENRRMRVPLPKGGEEKWFTLPLSQIALDAIDKASNETGLLFPSPEGKPFPKTDLVVSRKKLPSGHTLRRTFANVAGSIGVDESTLAILMNHRGQKTQTRAYQDPDKVTMTPRAASDAIGAAIAKEIGSL